MKRLLSGMVVVLACLAMVGCAEDPASSKGDDGGTPDGGGDVINTLVGTVKVPDTFTAVPKMIAVGGYLTPEITTIPDLIAGMLTNPDIGAQKPYALNIPNVKASGTYYMGVILFVEGGGDMMPVKDIDWSTETTVPVEFKGGEVSLGEITLSPFPGMPAP